MPLIRRFEDLEAWQAGRQLAQTIFALTEAAGFRRDFGLIDQVRRASASVMNNIVEGFDSVSPAEFVKFLGYARRSASEVQSCLYIALDRNYLSQAGFREAYDQAERVRGLIAGFIRYLRQPRTSQRVHVRTERMHVRT